jgi:transposase-like protein
MTTKKATRRNDPKRVPSSESAYSLMEFDAEFPDDTACMEFLFAKFYPNGVWCPTCERVTKHHRVKARTCYACQFCGHQEYPLAGTIFERSSTSLRLWFQAIYLMASTRCGISAKQLEREIGVSYPTAWRMFKEIRSLLADDDWPLTGTVEVDEAYIGGMGKWKHHQGPRADYRAEATSSKSMVLGMAERREGQSARIAAQVVDPATDGRSLAGRVSKRLFPASTVFTDEALHYWGLGERGYHHSRVNHSQQVYVSGDVHTNTIEGFWSLVKRGISGAHHNVSAKYLQSHLDEYTFRYNNREITARRGMFDAFLSRIEKA